MNLRITELIIKTLGKQGVIDSRAFGHWALSDEQLEKFAELIVQECANKVKDFYQEDEFSCYNAGEEIKQHFGVEK